jgi:hypothetical protein
MGLLRRIASTLLAVFSSDAPASTAGSQELFWTWFNRRQDSYFALDLSNVAANEMLFADLTSHLHAVDENLTFEFGPKIDGKRELVISADGIRSSFPAVLALVAAAPQLPHWKITAFRPRRYPVSSIEIGGMTLDPRQISVRMEPDGPKVDFTILLTGYAEHERNKFSQGVYLLLDEALGEYDVETRVGVINFEAIGTAPPPASVPLSELALAFDDIASSKTIH